MALEEGGDGLQQHNYLACTTSFPWRRAATVYYLFSFVYLVLFALWVRVLYANMAYASRIHYLMLVVVFLTALNMFCEGEDKTSVMRTGLGCAWELWFYTFSFLKGISLEGDFS
ncbi:hypothetical protein DM860_001690 [Cuscuta australis]|uniref:Uncharacterized protein n=1 Tax=Cuscuta australis TaxID=267555 RepID=A0A328E9J5_9ASTE|nr:hypothetical protein DM860_001690 [Cuscuta australis]